MLLCSNWINVNLAAVWARCRFLVITWPPPLQPGRVYSAMRCVLIRWHASEDICSESTGWHVTRRIELWVGVVTASSRIYNRFGTSWTFAAATFGYQTCSGHIVSGIIFYVDHPDIIPAPLIFKSTCRVTSRWRLRKKKYSRLWKSAKISKRKWRKLYAMKIWIGQGMLLIIVLQLSIFDCVVPAIGGHSLKRRFVPWVIKESFEPCLLVQRRSQNGMTTSPIWCLRLFFDYGQVNVPSALSYCDLTAFCCQTCYYKTHLIMNGKVISWTRS